MSYVQNNIVHYMHYNKLWYYWIDGYERKKYWRKLGQFDDINLLTEEVITEKECKSRLRLLFPNYKIMKAIPYHDSPNHDGSRLVKYTVDRKTMLKEKIHFRKDLEGFWNKC